MASKKTGLHKPVWERLKRDIAPELKSWGFAEHPIWEPGWDNSNQDYTYHLLHRDFERGILQATICYMPQNGQIDITVTKYSNPKGLKDLSAFDYDSEQWVDFCLRNDWKEFKLGRSSRWNVFGPHWYGIKFRRSDPSRNNVEKVFADLRRNLPLLKAAVFDDYKGWKVLVLSRSENSPGAGDVRREKIGG